MELLGGVEAESIPYWIFGLAWLVFVAYLAFERQ
jgi:hypothetical protein